MTNHKYANWGWGLVLAPFFSLVTEHSFAQETSRVFARFEADLLSEPESLQNSIEDWGAQFEAGERQWALAVAELGLRYKGLEFSWLQRAQMDLRINSEAAEFYGRIDRKEAINNGETVPLDLRVQAFSAEGLRVGYRHAGVGWGMGGGLSYLRAENLISGQIKGDFVAISDRDYNFNAQVDYAYHRDAIFERPVAQEPEGRGWAMDLAGYWQINQRWRLSAAAEDLFAYINWQQAPYTKARAHTERKTYDENGFAVFRPLISGREGFYEEYTQDLQARYRAQLQYSLGSWNATAQLRHQFGRSLGGFGFAYQTLNGQRLELSYWPELDAVALQFQLWRLQAELSLDSQGWKEANNMLFSLRYGF